MPSLKSLKLRIKSVKSTQKITKAMKMVAASKLKRARERAESAAPYADKMIAIIKHLAVGGVSLPANGPSLLVGTGKSDVHLVVVITSDRGLCGSFNQSIVKLARKHINDLHSRNKKVKIVCLGKKGYEFLKAAYGANILIHKDGIGRKGVTVQEANEIAVTVMNHFNNGDFDICTMIYSKFKSVIAQIATEQQIIPLSLEGTDEVGVSHTPYEYEPTEEEVIGALLPKNIQTQIYKALLENTASEQAARMTAMDNATRNSGEMIKKFSTIYNRTRQAHITRELIEIISGAETIKG